MATPTIINVPWAKGKCDTYTLSVDGLLFISHMQPPGRDLLYYTSKDFHQDPIFMSCRDMGWSNWAPCARSTKKFNLISPGFTYRCKLILMIGVSYDDTKYALNYHYLWWKVHLGEYDSISQSISVLNISDEFICQMFDTVIIVDPATKVCVRQER